MTRSLVRAKRAMMGLPGGGGTPLALALKMACEQATQLQRQGVTPILVVLSDGRANVNLQGLGDVHKRKRMRSNGQRNGDRLAIVVCGSTPHCSPIPKCKTWRRRWGKLSAYASSASTTHGLCYGKFTATSRLVD